MSRFAARLGLAVVLLLELALFLRHAGAEVVPFYPVRHDQATYLGEAYETREAIRSEGLARGVVAGLSRATPNGVLLQTEAGLLGTITAAPRLSALAVNFLFFSLLQVVVFGTILALTREASAAFLGVGLLLTAGTPFFWAGGLFDFRLDFAAFCLFGVFVSLVVRSDFFASPAWSVAAGAAAALLVMHRFIAVVFVAGTLGLFAVSALLARGEGRRVRGAILAGLALLLAAPALLVNASAIHSYYVVNHVLGGDKAIRAAQQGTTSLARSLLFYPRSAAFHHTGPVFLLTAAALLVATHRRRSRSGGRLGLSPDATRFFGAALVTLYVVLTLDESKSPVVGNLFVPVVLWIVLSLVLFSREPAAPCVPAPWAAATLAAGLAFQAWHLLRPEAAAGTAAERGEITRLHDDAFASCRLAGGKAPVVSIDRIDDAFDARIFRTFAYERHGVLLSPGTALGDSLYSLDEAQTRERLERSDIAVVTLSERPSASVVPFEQAMERLRPTILEFCERRMTLAGRYRFHGRDVGLYARTPSLER